MVSLEPMLQSIHFDLCLFHRQAAFGHRLNTWCPVLDRDILILPGIATNSTTAECSVAV